MLVGLFLSVTSSFYKNQQSKDEIKVLLLLAFTIGFSVDFNLYSFLQKLKLCVEDSTGVMVEKMTNKCKIRSLATKFYSEKKVRLKPLTI